jgi:hypothetical protein
MFVEKRVKKKGENEEREGKIPQVLFISEKEDYLCNICFCKSRTWRPRLLSFTFFFLRNPSIFIDSFLLISLIKRIVKRRVPYQNTD